MKEPLSFVSKTLELFYSLGDTNDVWLPLILLILILFRMYITWNNSKFLSDMVSISLSSFTNADDFFAFCIFLWFLSVDIVLMYIFLDDSGSEIELNFLGYVIACCLGSLWWH